MRFLLAVIFAVSAAGLFGCSEDVAIPETTQESVAGLIKPKLEKIAETGDRELVDDLKSYIVEDLAGVDQAKSDALMKDYNELAGMSGAEQIKAKAKEMLGKL